MLVCIYLMIINILQYVIWVCKCIHIWKYVDVWSLHRYVEISCFSYVLILQVNSPTLWINLQFKILQNWFHQKENQLTHIISRGTQIKNSKLRNFLSISNRTITQLFTNQSLSNHFLFSNYTLLSISH